MEYNEIVYVLTHAAMPDMVKIGKTNAQDVTTRMRQLYTTALPTPFDCAYAKAVENATELEAALHKAFEHTRVNPRREFFQIGPEQPVALLRVFPGNDVTPTVNNSLESGLSQSDRESANRIRRQRPPMNFLEMGIPVGSNLVFQGGVTSVETVNGKKVRFDGDEKSLTAVTRILLDIDYNVQPAGYWYFNDELLRDIYNRTYIYDD
jgi:hypothetical protein